jgi:hypothetical protein
MGRLGGRVVHEDVDAAACLQRLGPSKLIRHRCSERIGPYQMSWQFARLAAPISRAVHYGAVSKGASAGLASDGHTQQRCRHSVLTAQLPLTRCWCREGGKHGREPSDATRRHIEREAATDPMMAVGLRNRYSRVNSRLRSLCAG